MATDIVDNETNQSDEHTYTCDYVSHLKGIILGHLNVCHLINKIDALTSLLTKSDIDILTISEAWLNSNIDDGEILIPGYYFLRQDRDFTKCKVWVVNLGFT